MPYEEMKAIINLQFLAVMGIRIHSKGNLIQSAVGHAIEENTKEICKNLSKYFKEKNIQTNVEYTMEGKSKARITLEFIMISNIPVLPELLEKEKGLIASTENTIGKVCNILEQIFAKKGIRMKSDYKVYAD